MEYRIKLRFLIISILSPITISSCDSPYFPEYENFAVPKGGVLVTEIIPKKWDNICFASQYELPDQSISALGGRNCWEGNEVPSGKTALTFIHADKTCTVRMISADFLAKRNSETRCFSFSEAANYKIKIMDEVLKFEIPK